MSPHWPVSTAISSASSVISDSTSQVVRSKQRGRRRRSQGPATAAAQGGSVRSSENARMPRATSSISSM